MLCGLRILATEFSKTLLIFRPICPIISLWTGKSILKLPVLKWYLNSFIKNCKALLEQLEDKQR